MAGEFAGGVDWPVRPGVCWAPMLGPRPQTFSARALGSGFHTGDKGTHTSRTMMLAELTAALDAVPPSATRADYAEAIIEGNCLHKSTSANRRLSNQRLGELYALNPEVLLFRVLRRLWEIDHAGRPLIALLCAIARDPLLASTVPLILEMSRGEELNRTMLRDRLRAATGERFKDDVLDKVGRNVASSWTQSGHLQGRTFKRRARVEATPAALAYSLFLGEMAGFQGEDLLSSPWVAILDCSPARATELALEAKRINLIDLRTGGGVFQLNTERLDPLWTGR